MNTVGESKISRQYEYLVTELESSDSSIASTIREVFESEKPEDHKAFLETLSRRLALHNSKIVKMCSNNYALFSGSILQLVNLCPDVDRLQVMLNQITVDTAHAISVVKNNQEKFRKSVNSCQNVIKTRNAIEQCLPVLRMHSNMRKLLKSPDLHYHALKMLEELNSDVLPLVDKFKFSAKLKLDLKRSRQTIITEVNKSFKTYLETAWAYAKRLGCNAMKVVVHTSEQFRFNTNKVPSRSPSKGETMSALTHSKYAWESIDESMRNVEEVIDFKELFKCQLIFNTLEKDEDAFGRWYETHRRDQLTQLLLTGFGKECRREKISQFFEQVIGFFIIESYVVDAGKRIVSWNTICASSSSHVGWWDETVAYIEAQLLDELPGKIHIVEDLKFLKEILLLFCHTAESLSLPSLKLKECAFQIRQAFVAKLYEAFLRRFVTILWKEKFEPITISSTSKVREIGKVFPINHIEAAKGTSEIGSVLPFSECVPKIYFTLKEFVTELQSFCMGFQYSAQLIEDFITKSLDSLVETQLKESVLALIASREERAQRTKYLPVDMSVSRGTLDLGELSQLSMNCECLSEAMPHLGTFIAMSRTMVEDPRGATNNLILLASMDPLQEIVTHQQNTCKLNAGSTLASLVFDVQYRMRDYMKFKIDAILEMIDYNWTEDQQSNSPSLYVAEVTAYLKNVRLTNKNTQSNVVAVTTYMEACKHIAEKLKMALNETMQISFAALKHFEKDLTCFENFTAQLEFPPGDAETLRLVFVDVRQLVNLIISFDFVQFVSATSDSSLRLKYNRVRKEELLSLLEKVLYHEDHRRRTTLRTPTSTKDLKRNLENATRELRMQLTQ